jgi:hypothetical protein
MMRRCCPLKTPVLGLALWITLGTALLYAGLTLVCGGAILRLFDAEALGNWVYLVPLGLWLTGLRVTLGYWANRRNAFVTLGVIGWMSRFGERLALPLDDLGEAVCPHTGERYRLQAGRVELLGA